MFLLLAIPNKHTNIYLVSPQGERLPCLVCCLSSLSLMWKHVYKVSYFFPAYTGDGVTLKNTLKGSSELLFSFGPRVRYVQSYSPYCGLGD